jgi:hypothetical protein
MHRTMKYAAAAMLSLGLLCGAVRAADAPGNAQQERMKTCNADAKTRTLAGDARRKFMSSCLSGEAAAGSNAQQNRMKTCNADAKTRNLAGDERKQFMSRCLSGG